MSRDETNDDIIDLVRQHHLSVMVETRSSVFDSLLAKLPGVTCFSSQVQHQGRKGGGVAIFVHSTIKDHVSVWRQSDAMHAIWLRVDK